jgi:hypothetical protein
MVEMSDDVVGELLSALFKLEVLQLRLGITATEAMLTFGSRANQPIGALNTAMPSAISEEEVEAAAQAIEVRLMAGHELGFQCLLRVNFSGDVIRDMARGPRGGGGPQKLGRAGDHRAAYSATAGRAPVPLHHFGRGRRPLGEQRRPLIARQRWHGLGEARATGPKEAASWITVVNLLYACPLSAQKQTRSEYVGHFRVWTHKRHAPLTVSKVTLRVCSMCDCEIETDSLTGRVGYCDLRL